MRECKAQIISLARRLVAVLLDAHDPAHTPFRDIVTLLRRRSCKLLELLLTRHAFGKCSCE